MLNFILQKYTFYPAFCVRFFGIHWPFSFFCALMDAKNKTREVVQWLEAHPLIKIASLSAQAGVGYSKVREVIRGTQKFQIHQLEPLLPIMENYGFSNWKNAEKEGWPATGQVVLMRFKDVMNGERRAFGVFGVDPCTAQNKNETSVMWSPVRL